jgi:hypothetical protein
MMNRDTKDDSSVIARRQDKKQRTFEVASSVLSDRCVEAVLEQASSSRGALHLIHHQPSSDGCLADIPVLEWQQCEGTAYEEIEETMRVSV